MPTNNPNDVELDLRNSSNNGDGWVNVNASNGQPYSYKYTGGDASTSNGNVTCVVNNANAAIKVNLVADARYQFIGDCITFKDDPTQQLSTQGSAPRTRVVNNKCNAALNARYKIRVTDTGNGNGNVTIQCDPMLINVQPA